MSVVGVFPDWCHRSRYSTASIFHQILRFETEPLRADIGEMPNLFETVPSVRELPPGVRKADHRESIEIIITGQRLRLERLAAARVKTVQAATVSDKDREEQLRRFRTFYELSKVMKQLYSGKCTV